MDMAPVIGQVIPSGALQTSNIAPIRDTPQNTRRGQLTRSDDIPSTNLSLQVKSIQTTLANSFLPAGRRRQEIIIRAFGDRSRAFRVRIG